MSVCDHIENDTNCPILPTGRLICDDDKALIPLDYCDRHGPTQVWFFMRAGHTMRMERLFPDTPRITRHEWERQRVDRALDVLVRLGGGPSQVSRGAALGVLRSSLRGPEKPGEPIELRDLRRIPVMDESLEATPGKGRNAWP